VSAAFSLPLACSSTSILWPRAKSQQAAQWSQVLSELKKVEPRNEQSVEEGEAKLKELTSESRNLAAKGKEIEDMVYDLKAVNSHERPVVDRRTPVELVSNIEAKGREISHALEALRQTRGLESSGISSAREPVNDLQSS